MSEITQRIRKLLKDDRRYKSDGYQFVQEALNYAQNILEMGEVQPTDMSEVPAEEQAADVPQSERHLTGQQLCEAIRRFAIDQYGLMAKVVLNSWGIKNTGDFGEIVYNLISIGCMKKSKDDRREDFDDVYDFEDAFHRDFQITRPSQR